ncbi:AzlD domain-containing protein [Mesorhizobium microcysteis]|uniref:AzlD domain-containing protein n=1 Tax=Neoaquamicrobium microcysteis TaxID=2682781 RepID=A0A5D4GYX2_9HYPH|nr:AzlD domain-containing protein [Mesorhizobium microcysteis]TYR33796.1 AzlD domain-containing protein [Mesorhizobium microcysteis]
MTFDALDTWWWPYLFILIAGWFATNAWRFLGVYLGGRLREDTDALVMVRALATALVAAVIGNLIVFPSGALAAAPMALRMFAAAAGFATYLLVRKSVVAGILAAEAVLITGLYLIGFDG